MQFTPLRQALDGRMQRRIKRNHMAEEVEGYEKEKRELGKLRKQIAEKDSQLKSLKAQLSAQNESRPLSSDDGSLRDPMAPSSERIDEIEAELNLLRRSFQEFEDEQQNGGGDGIFAGDDWTDVPLNMAGPASESGDTIQIFEDNTSTDDCRPITLPMSADTQDAAVVGLELESARQAKRNFLQSSFTRRSLDASELHFADSPTKPIAHISSPMPKVTGAVYTTLSKQLKATTARAEDAELALEALEGEVRALSSSFTTDPSASEGLRALADHFRHIRLELERLMPGELTLDLNATSTLFPELITRTKALITQLATKTTELHTLRDQERTLRSNFDHSLLALERANLKITDLEKTIDDATADLLDQRVRANNVEKDLQTRETDNETLRHSLESYRKEVIRLESLITTMEAEHHIALTEMKTTKSDLEAKVTAETDCRRKAEDSAISRLRKIQALEEKLHDAKDRASEVQDALNESITGLNSRVASLSSALVNANAETERLRVLLGKCERKYREEVWRGEQTVEAVKEEMVKAAGRVLKRGKEWRSGSKVGWANWELESDDWEGDEFGGVRTPRSWGRGVTFADVDEVRESSEVEEDSEVEGNGEGGEDDHVPGSVEVSRGRKRSVLLQQTPVVKRKAKRRYDSGIGIDDGDESSDLEDSGLATPEMSSEADVEMEVELPRSRW